MSIYQNRRPGTNRYLLRGARTVAAAAFIAAAASVLLAGCASPGPPLPPSLKLPERVSDLTASRIGDQVVLHWTTPSRTTDKLLIAEPIDAEICRETPVSAPSVAAKAGSGATSGTAQGSKQGAGKDLLTEPCSPVVLRVKVTPGASQAVDTLPASLASGPARLLAYRVQLRNAAGRTAGASAAVFAAAGAAVLAVEDLRGRPTKAGVVLEWQPETGGLGASLQAGAEAVELDRTTLPPSTATASTPSTTTAIATAPKPRTEPVASKAKATPSNAGSGGKSVLPGAAKGPPEVRLRVGAVSSSAVDSGGTIDRTAQIGNTYLYTAQRVRSVVVGGQKLEMRSEPSAAVSVAMLDVFPPEAPVGLVAVPGFAGGPSAGEATAQGAAHGVEQPAPQSQLPAIDLSWEPDMEPRVVGYRVYRRDLEGGASVAWRLLDPEPLPVAAYRDLTVVAGHSYVYRVTALDAAGNESAPSSEVEETAPQAR